MYAVVRRYTGAGPLMRAMLERQREVEDVLRGVPGFRAYYALRAKDGTVATVTICDDQAGTSESTRRAADWVRRHLAGVALSPAEITEGRCTSPSEARARPRQGRRPGAPLTTRL